MKVAALVSVVAAGRQARDAQSLFNKMLGSHNNGLDQRNFMFAETDSLIQVFQFYLGNAGEDFSKAGNMLQYGCWCQIRNEQAEGIVSGHGTPVDELDAACKAWQQCRTCTTVDFSTDSECIPNEVAYEVGFDPVAQRIDCQFNPNECSINNCGCDETLAHTLTGLASQLNSTFMTNNDGSGFQHATECHAPSNGSGNADDTNTGGNGNGNNNNNGNDGDEEPERVCCGTYPSRFEYLPANGNKSCCGDVTYNTNKHECCAGGFLQAIGGCA